MQNDPFYAALSPEPSVALIDNFYADPSSPHAPLFTAPEDDNEPELLQIATDTLTAGEAGALDRRIDRTAQSLYHDLCEMRDRQGWFALGFGSFDKYLRSKSSRLGMDYTTVLRKIQAGDTRSELAEQGVSVKGLADTHTRALSRLSTPEQKAEAWKRAQEIAGEYQPVGKAAEFHREGKVLTSHVETAVAELLQFATSEEDESEDPFEGKQDFFAPTYRERMNAQKPLAPSQEIRTERETPEAEESIEMLSYVRVEREGDFLFVVGMSEGCDLYRIPMRIEQVRDLAK